MNGRLIVNGVLGLLLSALIFPVEGYCTQNDFLDACKENRSQLLNCDEVKKICSQVSTVKIPLQDKPSEQEKKALEGCSSDKLYYGYGNSPDPVRARKCAYLQVEQHKADGLFDGIPVLISVYANGEGIGRNPVLALKFACDDEGGAPAEYEGRIQHLNQLRQGIKSGHFDYCADITSGYMMGSCSSRQASLGAAKREKSQASLLAKWTVNNKQAFEKLLASWETYLKAREGEIDQSGTARAAMIIDDREASEKKFHDTLADFEQGKFPKYADDDYIKADHELNEAYKKIMSAPNDDTMGTTVTREDVKLAQRAWLKYRDAWLIFANQKYPSVSAVAWKTWLTRERTALLQEGDN